MTSKTDEVLTMTEKVIPQEPNIDVGAAKPPAPEIESIQS